MRVLSRILAVILLAGCLCDPMRISMAEAEQYSLFDVEAGNSGPWSFYTVGQNKDNLQTDYTPVLPKQYMEFTLISPNSTPSNPAIYWTQEDEENGLLCMTPEGDHVNNGQGSMIIAFTAPHSGNWEYSLNVKNIGTDVLGDGGNATWTFIDEDSTLDNSFVGSFYLGGADPASELKNYTEYIYLEEGETLFMRIDPGIDAWGDKFMANYTISAADKEGKHYENKGVDGYLNNYPETKETRGAPYRDDLMWIGIDGTLVDNMEYAPAVMNLLKKYSDNSLGVIALDHFPERRSNMSYYADRNIPVINQFYGSYNSLKYFEATDSFEKHWTGTWDKNTAYSYGGHSGAIPSEGYKNVFDSYIKSAVRNGASGYGHMDYIWFWPYGRGESMHNRQTIEAFRKDLKGEDEGLNLTIDGGEAVNWHFKDYAEYYMGSMLEPQDLGYQSWDEFQPVMKYENDASENPEYEFSQKFLLSDMLTSYEWLKRAQQWTELAEDEGGFVQIMGNPEDMANGADFKFLTALDKLKMATEEYFNVCSNLDGAYYHMPYLYSFKDDDLSVGVVLEGGGGGNAEGYYEDEVAYIYAYEALSAFDSDHMEIDFYPNPSMTLAEMAQNPTFIERINCILNYARGYADSKKDDIHSLPRDFISITSRRISRPWGKEWNPLAYSISNDGAPEMYFAKNGYLFEGIAEEGVTEYISDDNPQKIVSYSPDRPVQHHFETILDMVRRGTIENIVIPAWSVREIVTDKYEIKDIAGLYPEFESESEAMTIDAGSGEFETLIYSMKSGGYETEVTLGDIPLMLSMPYGKGKIYMVLFDPNKPENMPLSSMCYDKLFEENGIPKRWESLEAEGMPIEGTANVVTEEYLSRNAFERLATVKMYENDDDMTVVSVQNPMSRFMCFNAECPSFNINMPYYIEGSTKVKVLLEPDTTYTYAVMPSAKRGEVTTDADGYAYLAFEDTCYELFYLKEKTTENQIEMNNLIERSLMRADASTLDGNYEIKDIAPPVTNIEINGEKAEDGSYVGDVEIVLTASDSEFGSGIKSIEYGINSDKMATVVNRAIIDNKEMSKTIKLSGSGSYRITYQGTDRRGNAESLGVVELVIR